MEELKPCPFCGYDDIKVEVLRGDGLLYYYYECPKCHSCARSAKTEEEARNAWNKRN